MDTSGSFNGILVGVRPFGTLFSLSVASSVFWLCLARTSDLLNFRNMWNIGTLNSEMRFWSLVNVSNCVGVVPGAAGGGTTVACDATVVFVMSLVVAMGPVFDCFGALACLSLPL